MSKGLEVKFEGVGEVKGFHFYQLKRDGNAYLYEVSDEEGRKHYEVFEHKVNVQFDCISYPKSKAFGVWAWCVSSLERAVEKFNWVSKRVENRRNRNENI